MKFDEIDYSDLYKFIVSLGIALIAFSFLIPWLFLKEPFEFIYKLQEYEDSSKDIWTFLSIKQNILFTISKYITFISLTMGFTGFVITIWGLTSWKAKQSLLDEELGLRIKKLGIEIEKLSNEEIINKAAAEIEEVTQDEKKLLQYALRPEYADHQPDEESPEYIEKQAGIRTYLNIETKIQHKFEQCVIDKYQVLYQVKIRKASYDLILQTHDPYNRQLPKSLRHAFAVEIRYAKRGFKYGWIRDNTQKIILASEIFADYSQQKTIPVILFISPREILRKIRTNDYKARVIAEMKEIDSNVIVHFIAEEDIDGLSCEKIKILLSISIP